MTVYISHKFYQILTFKDAKMFYYAYGFKNCLIDKIFLGKLAPG